MRAGRKKQVKTRHYGEEDYVPIEGSDNKWVDRSTGEEVPGRTYRLPPRREKFKQDWYHGDMAGDREMSQDAHLTCYAWRVWACVNSGLEYRNVVGLTQRRIEEITGIDQANVSRAMRLLVERGYLVKEGREGRNVIFRVCHLYRWRGSAKSLREFLAGETAGLEVGSDGDEPC